MLIGFIALVVIIGVISGIYFFLKQLAEPKISTPTVRTPESSPRETRPQPAPVATTKSKTNTHDWIKKQYPNAVILDSRTIIKSYGEGERNFQNVYPAADTPYETYFMWTSLDEADFSRAMLYRAPFDGTSLKKCNFSGAYLEGASFKGANLSGANMAWADLSGTNLTNADLSGADLSYASVNGADLTDANLRDAHISDDQLDKVRSLKGAILPDGTRHE